MTPLRQHYIRDLVLRGKAERTQEAYISFVADLARFYRRSPDQLTYDEVAQWLFHLVKERKLSSSSVNIAVCAVRFLYGVTLGRETAELHAKIPRLRRECKRAHAYAVEEAEAILRAAVRPRDGAFLGLVYGCGLRLSEAVELSVQQIDRARMQVRVRGKGAKERLVPISGSVLKILDTYWLSERRGRPGSKGPWLFVGEDPSTHLCKASGQNIYYRAVKRSGVRRKGGIHVLRHSYATHLIESGVEITLVQRLLGHTSLLTTARYLHVTRQRLDRVRSAFDLIDTEAISPRPPERRKSGGQSPGSRR